MLKNKTFLAGAIAGAGVAAAALAGAGLQWPHAAAQSQSAQVVKTQAIMAPPPGAPMTFADIIERVAPAVVSIETHSKVTADALRRVPGFENFPFALPQPPGGRAQPGQPEGEDEGQDQYGAGSGFFISADGYVVTNNHVVENADEITVKLTDDRELKARVVGRDEATDMAVLKVDGGPFPFVDFETTAKPRVGDWVIAIGNPFTLGGTATAGIVSAFSRDIGDQYVDYIQIDAPINRGNSGGPTFDIYGRVIGINTAIYSPNGQYAGIGFAIPADVADAVTKQLISGGKVARGYLGVTIASITDDIKESLNLPDKKGAYVTEVTPGGPADRAGVRAGDIVTRLNGQPVKDNTELTRRVAGARAGDVLKLEIVRNGKPMNLEVRSGVRPSESELNARGERENPRATPETPDAAGQAVLGINVAPLDAATRKRFNLGAGVTGVVIIGIQPQTDAAKKGFRAGDVIVMADNRTITTPAELQAAVNGVKGSGRPSVLLLVQREGRNIPVAVSVGGK